jgi:hypothetical protein
MVKMVLPDRQLPGGVTLVARLFDGGPVETLLNRAAAPVGGFSRRQEAVTSRSDFAQPKTQNVKAGSHLSSTMTEAAQSFFSMPTSLAVD